MSEWNICKYDGVDHLEKRFIFKKYSRSLAFFNAVAGLAETYIHHPRMVLEWGSLTIAWGTHQSEDGLGILPLDRELADKCDRLYVLLKKQTE